MDNIVSLEVNNYGVCLDSAWTYIALSWQLIATAVIIGIVWRVYRRWVVR